MYLNKTPEVGDHIVITDAKCLRARQGTSMLTRGIVSSVTYVATTRYLNFKSGPRVCGVGDAAVQVLDPSQFPWRQAADPMEQYYGA